MPSHRLRALIAASLVLFALATCGYSRSASNSTDPTRLSIAIENATIHDVTLKDARDMHTVAHLWGGETKCVRVYSMTPFNLIAIATSGTGISPNRVTYSPPIHPTHSRYWDWRITSFGTPETGPLLQRALPC